MHITMLTHFVKPKEKNYKIAIGIEELKLWESFIKGKHSTGTYIDTRYYDILGKIWEKWAPKLIG